MSRFFPQRVTDLSDWPNGVTSDEVAYLNGLLSNIQEQLDARPRITTGPVPHANPSVNDLWFDTNV